MMNGATLSLICVVMPIWWPWKTLDMSQPMFTNFPTSSSTLIPQKSNIHLNIKEKMLSKVVDKLIISTHRRIGMRFHFCSTYKWIDNHYVLSIMVISSTLTAMKGALANVTLVTSNNTTCMMFAIPHLDVLDQTFYKHS